MRKIWSLFELGVFVLAVGIFLCCCGGGGSAGDSETILDGVPELELPELVADGVTGGIFKSEDENFQIDIPDGTMPAALRAQPEVSEVTTPDADELLEESETVVSNSYRLNLNSIDNYYTTDGATVTFTFDSTDIPAGKLNGRYVYVLASWDDDLVTPIFGDVDGSTITLDLRGLPPDAIFTVVYNPDMEVILSDVVDADINKATPQAPWGINRYVTFLNPSSQALKEVVAGILGGGVTAATVTTQQIKDVVRARVSTNATTAGTVYSAAGFREPNFRVMNNNAALGAAGDYFPISLRAQGSAFLSGAVDVRTEHLGSLFGTLYVSVYRIDDTNAHVFGTVYASVAHEMFHAIQSGYNFFFSPAFQYITEGCAATYGITLDKATGKPEVRLANATEKQLLSVFFGAEDTAARSNAYAHQDFFAYLGRTWNGNNLDYLADAFESVKTTLDGLVAAGDNNARYRPTRAQIWSALSGAFLAFFGQSLDDLYLEFAQQRAMEHSADSQLRSGDPSVFGLDATVFHDNAITTKSVDPDDLETDTVSGNITNIDPYSARILVLSSSKASDAEGGVDATLEITPTTGVVGNAVRVVMYRGGVGTELATSNAISGFGATAGDALTLLIVSMYPTAKLDVAYSFGPAEEEEDATGDDTLTISSLVIGGTSYGFEDDLLQGGFCVITGAIERSNLPCFAAADGSGILSLITDPQSIAGEGTYSLNGAEAVFNDGNGEAYLLLFIPQITHADNAQQVGFNSTGGTVTFTNYSTSSSSSIAGEFTVQISGDRTTSGPGVEPTTEETLAGTISGTFSVNLDDGNL